MAERVNEIDFGDLDAEITPERLGLADFGERSRVFLVSLSGPGFNDDGEFEEDLQAIDDTFESINFRPGGCVTVYGAGNELIDHKMTALLACHFCDLLRGVILIELPLDKLARLVGRKGYIGKAPASQNLHYCYPELLREYAKWEGFSLVN